MLIRRAHLERIVCGDIDLAFRRWRRPTVKAGGTLTTGAGVLAIDMMAEMWFHGGTGYGILFLLLGLILLTVTEQSPDLTKAGKRPATVGAP